MYDDLLPGERARLHAARAAALESGTAGPALPPRSRTTSPRPQDAPKVLVWSIRAADEAMRVLAPGEALQHLERALDGMAERRGRGRPGWASRRAAWRSGRRAPPASPASRPAPSSWARRAIRLCDADGDGPGGVQARAELVRRLIEVDATDQAVRHAEEAVRLAEAAGVDAGSAALAHVVLARALLSARRTDEARPQAERALVEARAAGVPGLEVEALTTAAFLDEVDGDREAAADRLGTALRLARAEGELAAELRAHYALASLHYYNGDVGGSLPVLRAAMTRVDGERPSVEQPGRRAEAAARGRALRLG